MGHTSHMHHLLSFLTDHFLSFSPESSTTSNLSVGLLGDSASLSISSTCRRLSCDLRRLCFGVGLVDDSHSFLAILDDSHSFLAILDDSLSPHLLTESSVFVARPRRRFSLSRRGSTGIGRFNSVSRWLSSTADGVLCLSVALCESLRWLDQVCLSKGHLTEEYAGPQVSLSLFHLVGNVLV
ncbi:hypothetical protein YC2023_011542 [Brassica napus]